VVYLRNIKSLIAIIRNYLRRIPIPLTLLKKVKDGKIIFYTDNREQIKKPPDFSKKYLNILVKRILSIIMTNPFIMNGNIVVDVKNDNILLIIQ